ncbi:MAG TPA: hypothetical protein DDW52_11560 [Planctomycetaceae bacterium]|nr:hypothetical protein [Planctomycetaceae bacterium]
MVAKARWKKNGQIYLFLGVGFGAYKAMAAGNFLQSFSPIEESDDVGMVALCDRDGNIGWVDYSEVEIIEIDGRHPSDFLDNSNR